MPKQKTDSLKVHEPMIRYFERHDMGDVLSESRSVSAKVSISGRTFVVTVDSEAAKRLLKIARKRKVSSTDLLRQWMREKILEQSAA